MRTMKVLTRSLLVSYLISALLLTLLAFALFQMKISPSRVGAAVYGIYGISCFFGGVLAGKATRNRKFFWGLVSGLLYFLLLALMSFLLHKNFGSNPKALTTVLGLCAACGTVGGMVS